MGKLYSIAETTAEVTLGRRLVRDMSIDQHAPDGFVRVKVCTFFGLGLPLPYRKRLAAELERALDPWPYQDRDTLLVRAYAVEVVSGR